MVTASTGHQLGFLLRHRSSNSQVLLPSIHYRVGGCLRGHSAISSGYHLQSEPIQVSCLPKLILF